MGLSFLFHTCQIITFRFNKLIKNWLTKTSNNKLFKSRKINFSQNVFKCIIVNLKNKCLSNLIVYQTLSWNSFYCYISNIISVRTNRQKHHNGNPFVNVRKLYSIVSTFSLWNVFNLLKLFHCRVTLASSRLFYFHSENRYCDITTEEF